jgi:hypothetical protein
MGFGWIYSIVMASLPLIGVSGYDKTSICLPMETESIFDRLYLFSLLTINAVAFVVICCCYAKVRLFSTLEFRPSYCFRILLQVIPIASNSSRVFFSLVL